jgi:hypothetical protein
LWCVDAGGNGLIVEDEGTGHEEDFWVRTVMRRRG